MPERLTRTFVETAMNNTTKALHDAGLLKDDERLEMRDSGGTKQSIRLDIMAGSPPEHRASLVGNCNLRVALIAIETLRNFAYFTS